jgi:dihydroxyacetone kinase-like protein
VTLDSSAVRAWLEATARVLQENRAALTELDAAIGDADHGINMDRGFKRVLAQITTASQADLPGLLKTAGMSLLSTVGGAAGPLYGSLFLKAAKAAEGKPSLGTADLGEVLQAALDGVVERGKAAPGAKTMVDALTPAVAEYRAAAASGAGMGEAAQRMVAAAERGMRDTIPMRATKGRASYLGERSIGHQDPGATSSYLILRALAEVIAASGD